MKPCILLDGAFDPLHAGHVAYILDAQRAFPQYDCVVSVCSDDDIRAKGREPLFDQETRAAVVSAVKGVARVIRKDQPTEHLITTLKPAAYVKGKDWEGKLPDEQWAACALHGVQIVYLGGTLGSSSDALRQWSLTDAERQLDGLEAFVAAQVPPEPWQPVTDYSFEARRVIEGPHADLILQCFGATALVLDYGCGPGHLVQMLNTRGGNALGYDPQAPKRSHLTRQHPADASAWGVVICREVLEHCPVPQAVEVIRTLFRLSCGFVYITTRFTDTGVFDAGTEFDVDPTHITCLSQPLVRALCVLNGGRRRRDLEEKLDHLKKGRVLVYEVPR